MRGRDYASAITRDLYLWVVGNFLVSTAGQETPDFLAFGRVAVSGSEQMISKGKLAVRNGELLGSLRLLILRQLPRGDTASFSHKLRRKLLVVRRMRFSTLPYLEVESTKHIDGHFEPLSRDIESLCEIRKAVSVNLWPAFVALERIRYRSRCQG